ncbi:MAG TPA: GNAT family N-acetyltransferase [Gemmatimonadales bacterium]|nr:GNAT family N-acetyltransferase [Gemmatimonadales bacterium]
MVGPSDSLTVGQSGALGSDRPTVRPSVGVVVRGAALADVPQLERLMAPYVSSGDLLPRSNYDLCRHIKEYLVAQQPGGEIVACGSLKIYSLQLGEVAGLAVRRDWQGAGLGRALLDALVREARSHGLAEVLALTRKPAFFVKAGFGIAEREHFPIKVWADCVRCPRNSCCDEIAVTLRL